jgi:phage-related protein
VQWSVHALNAAVETEIEALPVGLRARLTRLVEMIATLGLERVHEPHVKHIDGKLWEMRVKSAEGIARGLYVTASGRRVVILHVFVKKSQKTPRKALAIARQRLKEVDLT